MVSYVTYVTNELTVDVCYLLKQKYQNIYGHPKCFLSGVSLLILF